MVLMLQGKNIGLMVRGQHSELEPLSFDQHSECRSMDKSDKVIPMQKHWIHRKMNSNFFTGN